MRRWRRAAGAATVHVPAGAAALTSIVRSCLSRSPAGRSRSLDEGATQAQIFGRPLLDGMAGRQMRETAAERPRTAAAAARVAEGSLSASAPDGGWTATRAFCSILGLLTPLLAVRRAHVTLRPGVHRCVSARATGEHLRAAKGAADGGGRDVRVTVPSASGGAATGRGARRCARVLPQRRRRRARRAHARQTSCLRAAAARLLAALLALYASRARGGARLAGARPS
jgi:hypothetical protein